MRWLANLFIVVIVVTVVLLLLFVPRKAHADDAFDIAARGVLLYDYTKLDCKYAPIVETAIVAIDHDYATRRPWRSCRALHEALNTPQELALITKPTCQAAGRYVRATLLLAVLIIGYDDRLMAEIERLE